MPPPEEGGLAGTRSLYLLDLPFLHFGPLALASPPRGGFALSLDFAYANTFTHTWHAGAIQREFRTFGQPLSLEEAETLHRRHPQDAIIYLDGEVTRMALTAAYGLTDELAAAAEIPWLSFSALHLDSAIESFHDALGLGEFSRAERPRGLFQIVRQAPYGELQFDDRTPTAGIGDVTFGLRWRKTSGATRFAADLTLKAPTGSADDFRGSGSWDGGLLGGVSHRFGETRWFGVHLEAGLVVPGSFRGDTVKLDPSPFARAAAGVDSRLWRTAHLALSAVLEQSPLRKEKVADSSDASLEVTLGLEQRIGRSVTAMLSLTENVPSFGEAADIAVALGVRIAP